MPTRPARPTGESGADLLKLANVGTRLARADNPLQNTSKNKLSHPKNTPPKTLWLRRKIAPREHHTNVTRDCFVAGRFAMRERILKRQWRVPIGSRRALKNG